MEFLDEITFERTTIIVAIAVHYFAVEVRGIIDQFGIYIDTTSIELIIFNSFGIA